MDIKPSDRERFWSKVDKNGPVPPHRPDLGPCWLWKGSMFSNGYGAFWLAGQNRKANRVSYVLTHGSIADDVHALHHCDVSACVNPEHIYAGDHQQNMDDKVARGRQAKGDSHYARTRPELLARGDRHVSRTHPEIARARSKVTAASVPLIRSQGAAGVPIRQIARELNMPRNAVRQVLRGETWSDIATETPT